MCSSDLQIHALARRQLPLAVLSFDARGAAALTQPILERARLLGQLTQP